MWLRSRGRGGRDRCGSEGWKDVDCVARRVAIAKVEVVTCKAEAEVKLRLRTSSATLGEGAFARSTTFFKHFYHNTTLA